MPKESIPACRAPADAEWDRTVGSCPQTTAFSLTHVKPPHPLWVITASAIGLEFSAISVWSVFFGVQNNVETGTRGGGFRPLSGSLAAASVFSCDGYCECCAFVLSIGASI